MNPIVSSSSNGLRNVSGDTEKPANNLRRSADGNQHGSLSDKNRRMVKLLTT